MSTTKMYERIKWYKKKFVHNQYARIVEVFKDYEKITKTKMLEEIYKVYSDYRNIISICTVRELKYLKMILDKKTPINEFFDEKYEWERNTLRQKFLIQQDYLTKIFIPDEIIDKVEEALENVDYDVANKMDRINELLVSYCKIQASSLLNTVCSFGSYLTGYSEDDIYRHIFYNRVFRYYIMIYPKDIEDLGDNILIALHQDYYGIEDMIDEERKKQGIAGTLTIDEKTYKTLFYNDFDINNKKIKTFLNEIKNIPFIWITAIDLIREYAVLNIDRKPLKEAISRVPALKDYDLTEFFKIMDEAMDEMPSGALNGFTPNEAKKIKAEEIKNKVDKNRKYVRQTNACLSQKDAKLFYEIYFSLLDFTNNKHKIKPGLKIHNKNGVDPYEIREIIEVFWKNKEVIVLEFCLANPYKFSKEKLKIASEFKKGIREIFIIATFEKEYTAFMNQDKTYMVKGIYDNIDKLVSFKDLPHPVITTIIPFKNVLIYDGILIQFEINMGNNFEKTVTKEYANSIKYYHL